MDYSRLVPMDTFMGRFLSYMQSQETADVYDWWTGLWCISAAARRQTWVDRPRAPVYLNMFVVLVGESGVTRKTTSVATATRLVRHVLATRSDCGLIDAKVTPEKLDATLHERTLEHGTAQLCIAVPELAVFMGTERYIAHMPVLLTDLYDCPTARNGGGTLLRGAVVQRDVWVHLLSASTPIWLLKTVNPNVIEGGFTSRCYFIPADTPKKRIAWPVEQDTTLYTDLCYDLDIIANEARTHGPLLIDRDALVAFSHWYENRTHSLDPFRQSFEAREDAHVLRVAALLCINDGSWIVQAHHVDASITLMLVVKQQSGRVFESAESRSKFAIGFDAVRSHLIGSGMDPVSRSRLYMRVRSHMDHAEFLALIEVLHELGAIQRFEYKEGRGRPRDLIRGTQLLLSGGLGDAVLSRFT